MNFSSLSEAYGLKAESKKSEKFTAPAGSVETSAPLAAPAPTAAPPVQSPIKKPVSILNKRIQRKDIENFSAPFYQNKNDQLIQMILFIQMFNSLILIYLLCKS